MLTVLLMLAGSDLLAGIRIRSRLDLRRARRLRVLDGGQRRPDPYRRELLRARTGLQPLELAALELAGPDTNPFYIPEQGIFGSVPYGDLTFYSYEYFKAIDRFGSPADTPEEILDEPEVARIQPDPVLVQAIRSGSRRPRRPDPHPGSASLPRRCSGPR